MTVQQAMVDHAKKYPDKSHRPDFIIWAGRKVKTADTISVPTEGRLRAEFLTQPSDPMQGFEMDLKGYFDLAGGERVALLRTWNSPDYEPVVEYPFESRDGVLRVWNIYKINRGKEVVEKWTGNAGFWVDMVSPSERVYHCSSGAEDPPHFESLIFKITIVEGSC